MDHDAMGIYLDVWHLTRKGAVSDLSQLFDNLPLTECIHALQPSYLQKVLTHYQQIEVLKSQSVHFPFFPFSRNAGTAQIQVLPKRSEQQLSQNIHSQAIYFHFL